MWMSFLRVKSLPSPPTDLHCIATNSETSGFRGLTAFSKLVEEVHTTPSEPEPSTLTFYQISELKTIFALLACRLMEYQLPEDFEVNAITIQTGWGATGMWLFPIDEGKRRSLLFLLSYVLFSYVFSNLSCVCLVWNVLFSCICFLFLVSFVMPSIPVGSFYNHFWRSVFGENYVVFRVKSCMDALISLSEVPGNVEILTYEVPHPWVLIKLSWIHNACYEIFWFTILFARKCVECFVSPHCVGSVISVCHIEFISKLSWIISSDISSIHLLSEVFPKWKNVRILNIRYIYHQLKTGVKYDQPTRQKGFSRSCAAILNAIGFYWNFGCNCLP